MQSYSVEAVLGVRGVKEFEQAFENASNQVKTFDKIADGMKSTGKKMTAGITVPVVGMIGAIAKIGSEFEASMSKVAAVSGATGEEFEQLEERARELGSSTSFSATEAANGLEYMALAGWETEKMLSGLEPILHLAEAGALELGRASDLVTDSMAALGLEVDELEDYLDKVAQTARRSNTDIDEFMDAMVVAGGTFSRFNVPLEEANAFLGVLANRGTKGTEAGTALNAIMDRLTSGTGQAAKALDDLGLSAFDSEGNFKGMEVVLMEVEEALSGLTEEEKAHYQSMIAGLNHGKSFEKLMQGLNDEYGDLKKEVEGADGALGEMRDTMKDNLQGSFENMKSALEEVAISFYDLGSGPLRTLVDRLTDLFTWFGKLSDETKQWIAVAGLIAAAIGPVLWILGSIVSSLSTLLPILGALVSPVGLVVVAIVGLIAAIGYLWVTNEQFRDSVTVIWERIKEIIVSTIDVISEHVMDIVGLLREFWDNNIEHFLQVAERVFMHVWEVVEVAMEHVRNTIEAVLEVVVPFIEKQLERITDFWDNNGENIMKIVDFAFNFIKGVIDFVMPVITSVIQSGWKIITSIFDSAVGIIMGIVEFFVSLFTWDMEGMKRAGINIFKSLWDGIKGIVGGAWGLLSGAFKALWNSIKKWFGGLAKDALQWGRNMISGFIDGIKGMAKKAADAAKNVVSSVAGFLKFWSPAKKGEGRGIVKWGANMIDGFLDGVESKARDVERIVGSVTSRLRPAINDTINGSISTQISTSIDDDNIVDTQKQPAYITLILGRQEFSRFVEDITKEQDLKNDIVTKFT